METLPKMHFKKRKTLFFVIVSSWKSLIDHEYTFIVLIGMHLTFNFDVTAQIMYSRPYQEGRARRKSYKYINL